MLQNKLKLLFLINFYFIFIIYIFIIIMAFANNGVGVIEMLLRRIIMIYMGIV